MMRHGVVDFLEHVICHSHYILCSNREKPSLAAVLGLKDLIQQLGSHMPVPTVLALLS
jgi:hypothetical protein